MTKSLPRMFSPNSVIVKSDDVSTIFRVTGIPYGGPEYLNGKDLHGQYFDRTQTDYGRNAAGEIEVRTLYSFYDHALNDNIGKDRLGFAKFYSESDQGQLWDIEVMRAYQYHDMLLTLAQKGLLGASSQPVQTSVEIDYDSGLIKAWHPAEISLTPTPANPDAVVQIVKSFDMALATKMEAAEAAGQEEATEEELPTLEEIVNGVESEIDDLFNEENAEQVEPSEDLKTVIQSLADIKTVLNALKSEQEAFQTKSIEEHRTLATGIANTQNSLKSFAGHVATKLKMDVREIAQEQNRLSEQEEEAEEEVRLVKRLNSGIPADAPGKAKKGVLK